MEKEEFFIPLWDTKITQKCIGFITTLQRGTEWAAIGKVTQSIPTDFPTAAKGSARQ